MNHMNVFVAMGDLQLLVIFLLFPINMQSILLKNIKTFEFVSIQSIFYTSPGAKIGTWKSFESTRFHDRSWIYRCIEEN